MPVPSALRERLGPQASDELAEMIREAGRRWRDEVLELATERFGRMLAEEVGKIRVEMANLRAELKEDIAALRAELKSDIAGLRAELKGEIAGLRTELKGDAAALRADIFKWCFAFWVGQVAVMIGVLAFMLRGLR